ncbi:hypothetical protein UNDYM_5958 (plasmid) [Undibacterium sp. YM2]|nr:hypothetical protein UNDYM_5958 [Undibacterium sp. YM2]
MMTTSSFVLGFSTNLTIGLNSDWDPARNKLNILYPTTDEAMTPAAPVVSMERGTWTYPDISLHNNALSLLDALIPYQILTPAADIDAVQIGAGALLGGAYQSTASLQQLSGAIGVDLTKADYRYALVKLRRVDSEVTHASQTGGILVHARPRQPDAAYHLTESFMSDITKLPHAGRSRQQDYGDQLVQSDAERVLASFKQYGTHYVSALEFGDTILQVFAYMPEKFARIEEAYANGNNILSGPGSQDFVQFTTDSKTGVFGLVAEYGKVLCLSNSAAFTKSLHNQSWLDKIWSQKNSIFALFNPNASFSLFTLQEQFTEQTVSKVTLASMGVMIEQKRLLLWQRVFKGAMVQKYRDNVQANFMVYDDRDFERMLPADFNDVTSFIATPNINVYKARLDIGEMQFVAATEVVNFTLFANVLALKSNAAFAVPGKNLSLYAQVFDMRSKGQPRQLELSDAGYDQLKLACDEFLGALVVRNRAGDRYSVIVDGLRFGLQGSGAGAVPIIAGDVRLSPDQEAVPKLINSLQYSMSFAEAVLSDQSACANDGLQLLMRRYLNWIASWIPVLPDDPEVIALRVRAMDLANFVNDPESGAFVPILPFDDYQQYVQKILGYLDRIQLQLVQNEQRMANRRLQELVIDVGKTLNENIIESGKLVSGIVDANIAQQKDMQGFYQSMIDQGKAEAAQQQTKLNELNKQLLHARGDVDVATQQYKSAVEKWETMEIIKFGLDVATNLFSLGTSFLIPASSISAVKDLGLMAQRIQKTLNVLNATQKLYTGISTGLTGLNGAQAALDGLDAGQFGNPSSQSWDEMSLYFDQVMATGPDVKAEKAALQTAFKIMVLRGKAVAGAESSLHTIQRNIYTNQLQQELNARQAARLAELQNKLNPANVKDLDRSAIDLMGLTGQLTYMQNQMLTILARAFLTQDQALQYAYLQAATPITSFSLLKFSAAIVQQHGRTLAAKSALAPYQPVRTKPIEFVIEGVNPQELTNGNIYSQTIFLDNAVFYKYANARIIAVLATVEGVAGTDSGQYLLRLAYNGNPFNDRDMNRDRLSFRTPWRERIYGYQCEDNSPTFSDHGESWSEGVSRVTPFSTWEISFPATQTNRGLRFTSGTVTLRLSFVLEARIVDPAMLARLRMVTPAVSALAGPVARMAIAPEADHAALKAFALPSKENLLTALYQQGSCTNGWDVVFNMGLSEINRVLAIQYEELKTSTTYKNRIVVSTSEKYPGNVTINTYFEVEYGYPKLEFSVNSNNTARLDMEILKGTMKVCTKIGSAPEVCDPPQNITGETMTAYVPLGKVNGQVKVGNQNHDVLRVELNMLQGAFSIGNIRLSDATKVEFNKAVQAYFTQNPVVYLINQLDLTEIPTLPALKPSNFLFKPLQTASGNQMLQLYIMTGGRDLLNYSLASLNNVPEPLPQGQNTSMIVSSQLVFRDILPQSLRNNGWTLQGQNPGSSAKAWTATFTSASVTATVDLSPLNHSSSVSGQGGGSTTRYTYSIPGGNDIAWSLNGTTLKVQSNGQLVYGGTQNQVMNYKEHSSTTFYPCFFNCTSTSDRDLSTEVSLNVQAFMPLSVGGDGRNQKINIAMQSTGVKVEGHMSGGGPSGSDDLKSQVNQRINSQIPPQIEKKLSINFEAVSVFALKNLLFPSGNYISFSSCDVPGDLLLLGNIQAK